MSRPPLGTRFGDLSPEQRAALPVGTRLGGVGCLYPIEKIRAGQWIDRDNRVVHEGYVASLREIQYLPPEPDPRDSDGPDSDEGGGEMRGGDNDHDGDVPEVANYAAEGGTRWGVVGGSWTTTWWQRADAEDASRVHHGRRVVRLYWPPTCEGAEDAPRDCLP